jgi:hypothetical protein
MIAEGARYQMRQVRPVPRKTDRMAPRIARGMLPKAAFCAMTKREKLNRRVQP